MYSKKTLIFFLLILLYGSTYESSTVVTFLWTSVGLEQQRESPVPAEKDEGTEFFLEY